MAQIWMDEENAGAHSKRLAPTAFVIILNNTNYLISCLARSAAQIGPQAHGRQYAAAIGQKERPKQTGQRNVQQTESNAI